ncbi:hypothetical protein NUW54_g13177 [Trametes sanguinea]|uniref:Uncharacterized protein n=1 Tax=Trametes sanguinea TaxID=158606 RepID=A0ACC1MQS4_9APHY|nr:hypothetical protein NUW54_g13177 [Trametes sanguinea]
MDGEYVPVFLSGVHVVDGEGYCLTHSEDALPHQETLEWPRVVRELDEEGPGLTEGHAVLPDFIAVVRGVDKHLVRLRLVLVEDEGPEERLAFSRDVEAFRSTEVQGQSSWGPWYIRFGGRTDPYTVLFEAFKNDTATVMQPTATYCGNAPAWKAKEAGEDAKVMSVLAAGHGGPVNLDDLALKKNYSALKAGLASPTYTDLMMESLAEQNPGLSFVHIFPGIVRTPLLKLTHPVLRCLNPLLSALLYPVSYSPEDSAEYMLYALLHSGEGFTRRNSQGDDIGKTRYYGSEEERKRVWEHTAEEIKRALSTSPA